MAESRVADSLEESSHLEHAMLGLDGCEIGAPGFGELNEDFTSHFELPGSALRKAD
ncbi:hypothetical protein [Pseudomonas sp. FME51]|uniref:hypothetical protein n=1 Tax=Pseudomonas sp. FME51 TaxID=2742609 RepID=UPI00186906E8|nr:hypothetical protein [Pseudomonas sp. FME51]